MKYQYSARTKSGELQVGYVESGSREAAFQMLSGHDLYVLSIEAERAPTFFTHIADYFRRVKLLDIAIFTRQFSTMLEAEIPLGDTLKSLYRQTKNPILRETIFEVSSDIDAGLSLSQALERHGNVFNTFYVNLVRSAEVTGRVEEVMGFLADYLEKEQGLRLKVRNALIYPAFVVALFVVVAGILIGVVFPQIGPIFEESGVVLPAPTRLLIGAGTFLADWWFAVAIVAFIFVFMVIDYARSREGRIVVDAVSVKLPLVGQLFVKTYVARFAESTSVLIRGGIPIAQAIELAGETIGSDVYKEALREAAAGVRRGELLSATFEKNETYFPAIVSQMIAVGESTGKLDEMLGRLATFYSREVDDLVANLVELIQPALMVVIGVLTGLLFASLLLPLYSLVRAF
ncbi:MAG: type II secretion system F family protein [Candidatus Harrisonbacteria bacterium]|nr:type II secretion system F family protein [Candidatus Harrisonbacteria bacterium]